MTYYLLITLNRKFFCKVDLKTCMLDCAKTMAEIFRSKFRQADGYRVTIVRETLVSEEL